LSFDNSTSLDFYTPNFIYEVGDMILIETLNSYGEWTALPYIFGVDVHVVGSYEEDGTIWISLNNDDGTGYYPTLALTLQFRVGLIKQSGLITNPNLEFMTIDEVSSSLFMKSNFRRYPVLRNGKMIGVISRRDVLKACKKIKKTSW
jgi:hypothetical protein